MSTSTIEVARDAYAYYRQLRAAGMDHDTAAAKTARVYGRRVKDLPTERWRAAWDREQAAPVEAEPEPVVESLPPHPLDEKSAEITARIADLEGQRAGLALDSLNDDKAAERLAKLEREIRELRGDLEHVELAKVEAVRRARVETQRVEAKRVADARRLAGELQADREAAAGRVDAAALAFARALADHQGICAQQAHALGEATGRDDTWQTVLPQDFALQAAFAHALAAGSAPAGWVAFDHRTIIQAAPLAALDRHVAEPIPRSPSPSKGK